ncbi:chromosome partitioning protein ParA [Vibrio atypicus]|uniref:chromosome partitioning protein ParA n=1 Tax=Vibrio atypicus TaxID=558271 RepID=UPI0037364425
MEFNSDTIVALAVDAGLFILLVWFIILLLILREFRKFAVQVSGNNGTKNDDETYTLCQQSVEQALNYANENSDTLNDLVAIQQALELQVSQIKSENDRMLSEQDQATVDELNIKLSKSHQLIRKLRGDLDKSVKGLRSAKSKLLKQHDTVESLRSEKTKIEKEFEQLEHEYIQISESGGVADSTKVYQREKEQLLATIESYKQKLATIGDSAELQQELEATKNQLRHIAKEKQFIEKKYIELTKNQQ